MATDVYLPVSDVEITVSDPDRPPPVTTALIVRLRDNPIAMLTGVSGAPQFQSAAFGGTVVTAAKIADGAVSAAKIDSGAASSAKMAAAAVTRSKLKWNLLTDNITGLAAGTATASAIEEYSFYPKVASGNSKTYRAWLALNASNAAYAANLYIQNTDAAAGDFDVLNYYVDASPPYDLGDGHVPLFFFALIVDGKIVRTRLSKSPPWATGRHKVKPDFFFEGKPYRLERDIPALADAMRNPAKMRQLREGLRSAVWRAVEITTELKNRNMANRPHPFVDLPGDVVLIDPVGSMVEDLAALHDAGEMPGRLLMQDYLRIDATPLARKGPPGVPVVRAQWRNT